MFAAHNAHPDSEFSRMCAMYYGKARAGDTSAPDTSSPPPTSSTTSSSTSSSSYFSAKSSTTQPPFEKCGLNWVCRTRTDGQNIWSADLGERTITVPHEELGTDCLIVRIPSLRNTLLPLLDMFPKTMNEICNHYNNTNMAAPTDELNPLTGGRFFGHLDQVRANGEPLVPQGRELAAAFNSACTAIATEGQRLQLGCFNCGRVENHYYMSTPSNFIVAPPAASGVEETLTPQQEGHIDLCANEVQAASPTKDDTDGTLVHPHPVRVTLTSHRTDKEKTELRLLLGLEPNVRIPPQFDAILMDFGALLTDPSGLCLKKLGVLLNVGDILFIKGSIVHGGPASMGTRAVLFATLSSALCRTPYDGETQYNQVTLLHTLATDVCIRVLKNKDMARSILSRALRAVSLFVPVNNNTR
jgi:hypothetical protein